MSSGRDTYGNSLAAQKLQNRIDAEQKIIDELQEAAAKLKPNTKKFEQVNWVRKNFRKIWALRHIIQELDLSWEK
jgi:hypothetical protein